MFDCRNAQLWFRKEYRVVIRGNKVEQIKEWLQDEGKKVIQEETVMVVMGSNDL